MAHNECALPLGWESLGVVGDGTPPNQTLLSTRRGRMLVVIGGTAIEVDVAKFRALIPTREPGDEAAVEQVIADALIESAALAGVVQVVARAIANPPPPAAPHAETDGEFRARIAGLVRGPRIDWATGEALDRYAAMRGLTRIVG